MKKHCKFCGEEYGENAFVCLKCGALTENGPEQAKSKFAFYKAFKEISLLLPIVVIVTWFTLALLVSIHTMVTWHFWLTLGLTIAGSVIGLTFGIITKYRLAYCLNTASLTMVIIILLWYISINSRTFFPTW